MDLSKAKEGIKKGIEHTKEDISTFKHHGLQFRHHHINMLFIIIVFLIIILIIMIQPALVGYKISKQFEEIGMEVSEFMKERDVVKSNLLITQTNLESCKSLNNDYLGNLAAEKNVSFYCNQEKNELQSRYNQLKPEYDFNITRIKSEFEQKKNEIESNLTRFETKYNELDALYDSIVNNAAQNICCKAKVDNKEIDSYIIANSRIVCTTGEKDKISC